MQLQPILTLALFTAALGRDASAQTPSTVPPIGFLNVQGVLHENGAPINGFMDFCWGLFNASSGGTRLATDTNMNNNVAVSNGVANVLFHVGNLAALGLSPTQELWLELDVRPSGTTNDFVVLSPRQRIVPALFATMAVRAEEARRLTEPLSVDLLPPLVPRLDRSPTFTGTVATAGDLVGGRLQVGFGHELAGPGASIVGGMNNTNLAAHALIGGGGANQVQPGAEYGVIGGGLENSIGRALSNGLMRTKGTIGTGSSYGFIGGGTKNSIGDESDYCVVTGGYDNDIRDHTDSSSVGGGSDNDIAEGAHYSTIGGGWENDIGEDAFFSVVGGGQDNFIQDGAYGSTISGGMQNSIWDFAERSAIGGGEGNSIRTSTKYSNIGGGRRNIIVTTSAESAACNVIAGGSENHIYGQYIAIGGGLENRNFGGRAMIGGGDNNYITENGPWSFIGGGGENVIGVGSGSGSAYGGGYSMIGGGRLNKIGDAAPFSVIGGGETNRVNVNSAHATIAGGESNSIGTNSPHSVIGGGLDNVVLNESSYATIPGGRNNQATNNAFAAGFNARATNSGAFVWSDGVGSATTSTNANSVTFRARGGYRMFTSGAGTGAFLAAGSGSWTVMSDREAKEHFAPVNPQEVLAQVVALPVSTWNYKTQDRSIRHLGPTAQDFRAAFAVGDSDTGITTVDADGVALAAIQGLNQKLEGQIQAKNAEILVLQEALAELRIQVNSLLQPRRELER
jgi:hypothetical protein